ncbi:3-keto-5-aminohexanoate cleavage protein [Candidatus Bathyarchaeota archaeon]|nr:3-keto-5-aminohexanoate cleavage protein [Candidatus Bathyarchaeota archaeon]
MSKLIITAAVTGGEPVSREMTPHVPTTAEEITEETVRCWEAGASIVHLHAKEPGTGKPAPDPNPLLKQYVEMIQDRCDIITNVTTGGGRRASDEALDIMIKERCTLGMEMMSMNMGTVNLWIPPYRGVFMNDVPRIKRWAGYMMDQGIKPELEVYDTGMINTAKMLAEEGVFETPVHIQFVMVGRTGFLPSPRMLQYSVDLLPPGWTWSVCALGRHQIPMAAVATVMGGHVRVGFEDNVYLRRGELAKSNADLVQKAANIARELERPIASPDDAREILGIKRP